MNMMIVVLLLHSAAFAGQIKRIYKGIDDTEGKYPYVVALVDAYRHCTGTLISPNWVLTAAHCLFSATQVQFGNMSLHPSKAKTRLILNSVVPPSRRFSTNDIGLLRVRTISMKEFAPLSAVDYKAMVGHSVHYAGFGITHLKGDKDNRTSTDDDARPLQVGDGVITQCEFDGMLYTLGPFVCVSPRCSNKRQDTLPGDSGGPLFLDGKVVAVLHGGPAAALAVSYYTPVSPYLQWIYDVMNTNRTHLSDIEALMMLLNRRIVEEKLQMNTAVNGWVKNPRFISTLERIRNNLKSRTILA